MLIRVQVDEGCFCPGRAYALDAGSDLRTPCRFILRAHEKKVIDTGVHVEIPEGYVGMVKSKSGLMCHSGIVTDGTVDAGYSGSIAVCLFNHSNRHCIFEKGDKIAQLVIMPVVSPVFEQVENIKGGDRGGSGFGSTGR